MIEHNFWTGQHISIKGAQFIISGVGPDYLTYHYLRGGPAHQISRIRLNEQVDSGTVALQETENEISSATSPVLSDLPQEARAEVRFRKEIIDAVLSAGLPPKGVSAKTHIHDVLEQAGINHSINPPSVATTYRWLKKYRDSGNRIEALTSAHAKKGNRFDRLDYEVRKQIDLAAEDWLVPHRPSMRFVYALLAGRILEINGCRSSSEALAIPSFSAFCNALGKLDKIMVATRRFGKDYAERMYRTRAPGPSPLFPFERVEIDHSPLDMIIINQAGVLLGRPYLTLALDTLTRAVAGFFISFTPPSYLSTMSCLHHVMLPKGGGAHGVHAFTNEWSVSGLPTEIISDNGLEFRGNNIVDACATLKIGLKFMPRGKPWFKGRVERFFRSLNMGLVHNLPGTTKSNITEKFGYDASRWAAIQLPVLVVAVEKWIVDIYMQELHRGIGTSPALAWRRSTDSSPVNPVEGDHDLSIVLGYTFERTIQGGRIELLALQYFSPILSVLMSKMTKGQKVKVKVDPMNLGNLSVLHPFEKTYFSARAINYEYADGLPLFVHTAIREDMRQRNLREIDDASIYREKLALMRSLTASLVTPKKTTQKKAARMAQGFLPQNGDSISDINIGEINFIPKLPHWEEKTIEEAEQKTLEKPAPEILSPGIVEVELEDDPRFHLE